MGEPLLQARDVEHVSGGLGIRRERPAQRLIALAQLLRDRIKIAMQGEGLSMITVLKELKVLISTEAKASSQLQLLESLDPIHGSSSSRFDRDRASTASTQRLMGFEGLSTPRWRRRAVTGLALMGLSMAISTACGAGNQPPSVAYVGDQEIILGGSLVIDLHATDPDGDPMTWEVSGLPEGAQIVSLGPTIARLVWNPRAEDTSAEGRQYGVEVYALDGQGGMGVVAFVVTVYPSYGVPTFDLPSGLVMNLAQIEDLKLEVRVKDNDSTDVDISLLTSPQGAQLVPGNSKTAYLYWKPTEEQRGIPVHSFTLVGDDSVNEPTLHTLMVALINASGDAGCPGQTPTVIHQPQTDHVPPQQGVFLEVEASDADSLISTVRAVWSLNDGQVSQTPLTATDDAKTSWSGFIPTGILPPGGALLRYHLEVVDNDDATGAACDHVTRWPKVGDHAVGVYPAGSAADLCVDDGAEDDDQIGTATPMKPGVPVERRLCGADADHLSLEADLGTHVSAVMFFPAGEESPRVQLLGPDGQTLDSAQGSQGTLTVTSPVLVPGAHTIKIDDPSAQARMTYSVQASTDNVDCPSDVLEPNDGPTSASTLAPGVNTGLRVCPGDQDWFVINITQPTRVDLTLSFDHVHGDLDLELWDSTGTKMLAAAASLASPEVIAHDVWVPGTILARVLPFEADSNGYTLQVTTSPLDTNCPTDILGLHDTPETALTLFNDFYSKLGTCPEDPDWFQVDTNAGDRLELLIEPVAGTPLQVEIFLDPTGAPVAVGQQESGLVTAGHTTAEATHLWYRVSSTGTAQYDLLQAILDPEGPCQPDRFEPNDEQNPAPITPGVHTWLRHCGTGDVDSFQVELEPPEVLTVSTLHAYGFGYGDMFILGPDGVTLLFTDLDFGSGITGSVLAEEPGIYRIDLMPFGVETSLGYDLAIEISGTN